MLINKQLKHGTGGLAKAKEYIEREAFREYAMEMTESTEIQFDMCYPYWQFSKAIKEMPAADVAPVRHGRLVSTGYDELYCEFGDCTICGADNPISNRYCGQCGAKMDLEG